MEDERTEFLAAWLKQDTPVAVLCRAFGISRQTGYERIARFQRESWAAVEERSHARHHQAHAMDLAVVAQVVALREAHPYWGPVKLRARLQALEPTTRWPAASTIGALLHQRGLTWARRRRARAAPATQPLAAAVLPNDVWSADFKGWFRTGDGVRCVPFTLTDNASRFLLRCQVVPQTDVAVVQPCLAAAFREYGLPRALRTDNGPPFASTAAGGLSRLGAWCIRLGIQPDRIRPGHPEDNGRHERMHATLAQETTRPPQATGRAQQRCFDQFREQFNVERPHQALGHQPPASVYYPSPRRFPDRLPELEYPAHAQRRHVAPNGTIKWRGAVVFISQALAGEVVALTEIVDDVWRVTFGPVELGWLSPRAAARGRRRGGNEATLPLSPISPV